MFEIIGLTVLALVWGFGFHVIIVTFRQAFEDAEKYRNTRPTRIEEALREAGVVL